MSESAVAEYPEIALSEVKTLPTLGNCRNAVNLPEPMGIWDGTPSLVSLAFDEDGDERLKFAAYVEEFAPDIVDMATHMFAHGMMNPLSLVRVEELDDVFLVAGNRRFLAVLYVAIKLAEIDPNEQSVSYMTQQTVATEAEAYTLSLGENLHRKDLNPMEEARAFKTLQGKPWKYKQKQIAEEVARDQSYVSMRLSLLKLPSDVQAKIEAGKLAPSAALKAAAKAKGASSESRSAEPTVIERRLGSLITTMEKVEGSVKGEGWSARDLKGTGVTRKEVKESIDAAKKAVYSALALVQKITNPPEGEEE